jgi:hypothetical protein
VTLRQARFLALLHVLSLVVALRLFYLSQGGDLYMVLGFVALACGVVLSTKIVMAFMDNEGWVDDDSRRH